MLKAFAVAGSLVVTSLAAPASAQGNPPTLSGITSLTVFGDSLVDAGNLNNVDPSRADPVQGYFDGRFTNGYNYNDLISIALFGTPTVASTEGGTNFAWGGARATTTSGVPDLNEQLAFYQAYLASGNSVDGDGLFILNFGGNDIFEAVNTGAPDGYASDSAFLLEAARNYAAAVQTLNDLGARNILVTGFPNAIGPALPFSREAEIYLLSELAKLNLAGDTTLVTYSYLDFFGRLAADPTRFGLPADLNLTTSCRAAQAQPDCAGYFSFDGTHPTAAVHRALYDDLRSRFGITAAVPEPSTWMMLILGFAFIGGAMRRRNSGVAGSIQSREMVVSQD